MVDGGGLYAAVFAEQFKPELGFVGFLDRDFELCAELCSAPGTGGFTRICGNRGARAEELMSEHLDFFSGAREGNVEADDGGS